MRTGIFVMLVLMGCVAGSSQILAQGPQPLNNIGCVPLGFGTGEDDTDITACAKPLLNRQSLINTSSSIRQIILGRFDRGSNQSEPAGLELNNAQDIADRLSGSGSFLISPTADVAEPAASPNWNVWTDGKYSYLNDTADLSDLDGGLVNLIVGADYKVSDRLVLGLMGTYEASRLDGNLLIPTDQDTDGWGGGAYLGYTLTDNLVFSANVLGTSLDTDINGVTDLDSTRIQTSAALTGYWYSGTWRYSPSLTVAWSKEWQDDAPGLAAQTIETAVISPGAQIGNTFSLSGANTVEPWLGAQFDWAARNKVVDDALGTILNDPNVDLRLQTGLNFAFGANAQLALTGEISGILLEDSNTYTAGANFAFQF